MADEKNTKEMKARYEERYQREKQHGVKFFPDIIYKDMVVAFGLFILLIGLAAFVGVVNEPPADPSDATYIPRPEWYFLFLFQMLKYFPGKVEWLGTTVVPIIGVLALLLLPFYDRSPRRHWKYRKVALSAMGVTVMGVMLLTVLAVVQTPSMEEVDVLTGVNENYIAGQDLYSLQCVECHGSEGEGGEIIGVAGLEGVEVAPMNAPDFIFTRTDGTVFNVIDYGQPDLGMPGFGLAYGGELQRSDITAIVTFMRFAWDDRFDLPDDAVVGGVAELGPDQVPSYADHVEPIMRRTCVSCHRSGKENGNYFMTTYAEVIESGDNAPNLIAGDLNSNLMQMLYRADIEAGGPMPPTKALKPEWIEIWERWIMAGMPETTVDSVVETESEQ